MNLSVEINVTELTDKWIKHETNGVPIGIPNSKVNMSLFRVHKNEMKWVNRVNENIPSGFKGPEMARCETIFYNTTHLDSDWRRRILPIPLQNVKLHRSLRQKGGWLQLKAKEAKACYNTYSKRVENFFFFW